MEKEAIESSKNDFKQAWSSLIWTFISHYINSSKGTPWGDFQDAADFLSNRFCVPFLTSVWRKFGERRLIKNGSRVMKNHRFLIFLFQNRAEVIGSHLKILNYPFCYELFSLRAKSQDQRQKRLLIISIRIFFFRDPFWHFFILKYPFEIFWLQNIKFDRISFRHISNPNLKSH